MSGLTAGLVAATLSLCNAQGQCESHSLHVEKKVCGYQAEIYRGDLGRGTIRVQCKTAEMRP